MFNKIISFFDILEDKVRANLSHRSIFYAFIGGVAHVLFWRSVWHNADMLMELGGFWGWVFYEPISLLWTSLLLLITGLFVSTFIGERIIISGLKNEKKITEVTAKEIRKEDDKIDSLNLKIDLLMQEIAEIKNVVSKK